MKLKIKRLDERAIIPKFATDGAACFDLHAIVDESDMNTWQEGVVVFPGHSFTFRTGIAVEFCAHHALMVYSRSGHGFKNNARLANAVGVVDSDYRGEICVRITRDDIRPTGDPMVVKNGDRIAQAMIVALPVVQIEEVDELSGTARGAGGFGSTGK